MTQLQIGDPVKLMTRHGDYYARHIGGTLRDRLTIPDMNYETEDSLKEGVVLSRVIEPRDEASPFLVRIQSSCLFSESFWSTDCDCAAQLGASLDFVSTQGGLVIYLYEEGRGIGLRRKMEAIRLQQIEGATSSSAFACLGLGPDPRNYDISAATLRAILGEDAPIVLLTNNEHKAKQLSQAGVNIVERRSLIPSSLTKDQLAYLRSKRDDLGHDIPEGT